jgi:hypothetical protein
MQRGAVDGNLSQLAFEFFFAFSRFEFALKENQYLKTHAPGMRAEPGWSEYVSKWQDAYRLSASAQVLLQEPPKQQVIGTGSSLTWRPVGLDDCKSELSKIVRLLKTVRNNLFHGGKHGGSGWDDPQRTSRLLSASLSVVEELVKLAALQSDYAQIY